MEVQDPERLRTNLTYLGICILIGAVFIGAHNIATSDERLEVGYVELDTTCIGIDAGVCLGLQKRTDETINYDDYEKAEPGTENYYRRVESELMARAYNTCTSEMSGMEWTSEVEYENKTASEWLENENIDLLPCESTFYREMKFDRSS